MPWYQGWSANLSKTETVTGFTLYLFTVYGAFYGIFLFDENLENYHFLGTVLVFFGIYLVKRKVDNEQKA